jgi:hypothetical protein
MDRRRSAIGLLDCVVLAFLAAFFATNCLAFNVTPTLGVGVHSMMLAEEAQEDQLNLVHSLAMNSVRTDAFWKYVEIDKGKLKIPVAWDNFVNGAVRRGLNPILILDYGNQWYEHGDKPRSKEAIEGFVRYAQLVVSHFKGRVGTYEVWNEWDNTTGGYPPGEPEDYARLFRAVYPAVKAIDKSAVVLAGSGIGKNWFKRLAELGVVAMSDGVSVHPYNYDPTKGPEVAARYLSGLERDLVYMSGRPTVDVYVTEIGWPTYFLGRHGYGEQRVREFAIRSLLLLPSLPFVKGIWWYDLVDDGGDPFDKQDHFGLFLTHLAPKAARYGVGVATQVFKAYTLSISPESDLENGLVIINARKNADDTGALIGWSVGPKRYGLPTDCARRLGVSMEQGNGGYGSQWITDQPVLITLGREGCSAREIQADH